MFINLVLCIVALVAALYAWRRSAFVVVLVAVVHWLADPYLSALAYYGYGAVAYSGAAVVLSKAAQITEFDRRIIGCAVAFAAVHALGWFLYEAYVTSAVYNLLCSVVYFAVIGISITGGSNGRRARWHFVGADTRAARAARSVLLPKHKGKFQ